MPKCVCGLTRASFNLPGETIHLWCSKCKDKDAIDIRNKRCECSLAIPCFNLPGETSSRWCKDCPNKPKNAINVKNKRCECSLALPSFNLPGETTLRWCQNCPNKPKNAINIKNKRCECGLVQPTFSLPGETTSIWCFNCPNKHKDAVSNNKRRCGCGLRPSFNLPGEITPIWCSGCKSKGAINIISKKCQCGLIPVFNLPGETRGIWCKSCPDKHKDAVDVSHKLCKTLHCGTRVNNKYNEEYCVRCFAYMNPEQIVSKRFKMKEKMVFDAVLEGLEKCDGFDSSKVVLDKMIKNGCSRRRPDFMYDCLSHWICGENDENQHKNYDTTCDQKRTSELFIGMACRPMILIRFNCDKYESNTKKYESLFKVSKEKGMISIRNKKEFKKRIDTFVECIMKHITTVPDLTEPLTTEYLFYDE